MEYSRYGIIELMLCLGASMFTKQMLELTIPWHSNKSERNRVMKGILTELLRFLLAIVAMTAQLFSPLDHIAINCPLRNYALELNASYESIPYIVMRTKIFYTPLKIIEVYKRVHTCIVFSITSTRKSHCISKCTCFTWTSVCFLCFQLILNRC